MDEDTSPPASTILFKALLIFSMLALVSLSGSPESSTTIEQGSAAHVLAEQFPPPIVLTIILLLLLSAFFSGSEVSFFSIHKLRLRSLKQEPSMTARRVAAMMERPNRLLTTILTGNMIVNLLIGLLLGARADRAFEALIENRTVAYVLSVTVGTSALVIVGDIIPKILALALGERFARATVFPLMAADRVLAPLGRTCERFTDFLFRVTRFTELHAAPFITDEEFKSALSDGSAQGAIEEDERQMIQGILEFTDAPVREILVPRPDVVAVSAQATVAEALERVRTHEYSRLPVYEEDIDHIAGLLMAKDLLSAVSRGEMDLPIRPLLRPPHYVPETMTIQQFVKDAQRRRTHLAIAVDEYGGTAGIVTLEDALEEVVGDIVDDDNVEAPSYTKLEENMYRVKGSFPLDELSELLGVALEDETHETVAGFLMNKTNKVPEPGDHLEQSGVRFIVETCEGKRASDVRIQVLPREVEEAS